MRHLLLAAAALVLVSTAALATEYEIDPQHSSISFKAKHVAGKDPGRFKKFSGTFTYDPKNVKAWKAEATIDAASIDTDVADRDKHLKSDAFFDVEKCPNITFKSTKVQGVKGDHFKLLGDLTMHCVTKPVALDVESNGSGKDPWGNESASFSAAATVNRKDWGISWNKTLDNGSLFVSEKIDLSLEITGNVKKAEAPASK